MPTNKLILYKKVWFGYASLSSDEYYGAAQANVKIEKRVKILRDTAVCNLHVVKIKGAQYQVGRVDHGHDKNGVPITFVTLERVASEYDID